MREVNQLINEIDDKKYKCISFDIFDTLLKRSVQKPEDLFELVELNYNKMYTIKLVGFKKMRCEAEQRARKKTITEDVTLDEIYQNFKCENFDIDLLKQLEIDTEIMTAMPNLPMVEVYNYCRKQNKLIIITSDMYLSKTVLAKMLEKIGIKEYKYIYISGEIGYTKHSGNIWKYIIPELCNLGIKKEEILHIGDNGISDYVKVKNNGIAAYLFNAKECVDQIYWNKNVRTIEENHFIYSIINSLPLTDNEYFKLGYSLIGPFLYNYCRWLHEKVVECDNIMFMAREGYLIEKIYKIIYPNETERIHYIRLNKNTLRLPSLHIDSSIDNFIGLITNRLEYTIGQILTYMGIEHITQEVLKVLEHYGYQEDTKIQRSELKEDIKFSGFYNEMTALVSVKWEKQYQYLYKYLESNGFVGTVALVNNSIEGTAQSVLQRILDVEKSDVKLSGIHFIISLNGLKRIKGECKVLFDEKCSQFQKIVFCLDCLVLENLLFEAEGTALQLEMVEEKINVRTDKNYLEKCNNFIISSVQGGAVEFVKNYCEMQPLKVDTRYILDGMCNFYLHPTYKDAKIISKIVDYDDGKKNQFSYEQSNSTWRKRMHDLQKNKDIRWPQGFLVLNKASKRELSLYELYHRVKVFLQPNRLL